MFGLRQRNRTSGKTVWAFLEYDCVNNKWVHVNGPLGIHNFIFHTKLEAVKHLGDYGLNVYDWEIVDANKKRG
jgi:hypothetical protein